MIRLIGSKETLEERLAASGLEAISNYIGATEDLWVYGCGPFRPGRYFDELIEHAQAGTLLGVVALWFTEHAVSALPHELRAHLGAILQLAPSIYVPDDLGACADKRDGWSLHYAVRAKLGGHPAWCSPTAMHAVTNEPVSDVGSVIACAIAHCPFQISPPSHKWGSANNINYSEMQRFINQVGLAGALHEPIEMSNAGFEVERTRAINTITEMYNAWKAARAPQVATSAAGIWAQVAGACATSGDPTDLSDRERQPGVRQPRELVLGTPFDPSTHYDEDYFAEGAGLRYTRSDGTKAIYKGPAHEWEGMGTAAQFLEKLIGKTITTFDRPRLIDIGCGSGCFVGYAQRGGFFDARGYDISEAAVARAQAKGRAVELRNVVTDPLKEAAHVVSALDFWEHIYLDDLDALIEAVKGCILADIGFGFFIICTRTATEQDWTIKKGDCFTKENSWALCAGHLTLRTWGWWVNRFASHGLKFDYALAYHFQTLRDEEVGLQLAESWRPKNLVVVRRSK